MLNLKLKSIVGMVKADHILVSELKNRDEDAFRELIDMYQDRIYNTCIGFVRDPDDADDLTQDVFIEIYSSIGKFRGEAKLSTWIYRITVNKSLEHIRKMKRKKKSGFILWSHDEDSDFSVEVPDFDHPGILVENKERARILFRAIEKLPENQKIAFTLHKVEDLSYEQISDVMQKSLSSVESLMHRAKINLRKKLYNYYKS